MSCSWDSSAGSAMLSVRASLANLLLGERGAGRMKERVLDVFKRGVKDEELMEFFEKGVRDQESEGAIEERDEREEKGREYWRTGEADEIYCILRQEDDR